MPDTNRSQPSVWAVVVTYNGSATLRTCLENIQASLTPLQVVVVDNASTDHSAAIIQDFSGVNYLPQQKNLGFGAANNLGIQLALHAGADYIFLLNQDAYLLPDTVAQLLSVASTNESYGVFSPLQLNGEGSGFDEQFTTYLARIGKPFLDDLRTGSLKEIYPVQFVNAAAWLLPRSSLLKVGGFDPLFFLYGEDNDLISRLQQHGLNAGIVPGASVRHDREKTSLVYRPHALPWKLQVRKYATSMLVVLKRTSNRFGFQILKWIINALYEGLNLLADRKFRDFLALSAAFWLVAFKLPAVANHRRLSLQIGPHWLGEF